MQDGSLRAHLRKRVRTISDRDNTLTICSQLPPNKLRGFLATFSVKGTIVLQDLDSTEDFVKYVLDENVEEWTARVNDVKAAWEDNE